MVELDNICSVEQVDAVLAELDNFEAQKSIKGCVAGFVRLGENFPSAVVSYDHAFKYQKALLNDGNYTNIRTREHYVFLREQLSKVPSGA